MLKVIGFYKKWTLAERDGTFYVVSKEGQERKIVSRGTEELCTKVFAMLIANFINEDLLTED